MRNTCCSSTGLHGQLGQHGRDTKCPLTCGKCAGAASSPCPILFRHPSAAAATSVLPKSIPTIGSNHCDAWHGQAELHHARLLCSIAVQLDHDVPVRTLDYALAHTLAIGSGSLHGAFQLVHAVRYAHNIMEPIAGIRKRLPLPPRQRAHTPTATRGSAGRQAAAAWRARGALCARNCVTPLPHTSAGSCPKDTATTSFTVNGRAARPPFSPSHQHMLQAYNTCHMLHASRAAPHLPAARPSSAGKGAIDITAAVKTRSYPEFLRAPPGTCKCGTSRRSRSCMGRLWQATCQVMHRHCSHPLYGAQVRCMCPETCRVPCATSSR